VDTDRTQVVASPGRGDEIGEFDTGVNSAAPTLNWKSSAPAAADGRLVGTTVASCT